VDAGFLGEREQSTDRRACAAVTDVDRHRFTVGVPGDVRRAGDREQVVGAQRVGRPDDEPGQLAGSVTPRRVVVQIVVQCDAFEPGVLGQLKAFAQRHSLPVRKCPEVDQFFHAVGLGRSLARIGWDGRGSRIRQVGIRA